MTPAWAWPLCVLGCLGWVLFALTGGALIAWLLLAGKPRTEAEHFETIPSRDEKQPVVTPGHDCGPVSFRMLGWEGGCMVQYDANGKITWAYRHNEPDLGGQDPDEWLRGLTP